jgi:hypothetical protein
MKNHWKIFGALGLWILSGIFGALAQTNDVHKQALDVLRKAIEVLEPPPKSSGVIKPRPARELGFAEAEKLYLQGKMSGKEYQRYLDEHKVDPLKVKNEEAQNQAVAVLRKEMEKTDARPPNPSPANAALEPAPGPEESTLAELERKMDELIRLRAARTNEMAPATIPNASTNLPAAQARSKRQQLDDLLKLYIDGKIPDSEYKERRGKLLTSPD